MDLRVVSDDGKTIVLEHDAVPGAAGFRVAPMVKDGAVLPGKWAHTWDGSATRHKFASGFPPYTVEALMAGDKGVYPVEQPPPPPPGEVAPERARTITGQSGLTAQNDTRYIDCPGLSFPNAGLSRVTVIGSQFPTTQLRGVQDVWIEGRPDAYMNCGPRTDGGDLLQIKVNPSGYAPCDKLVLRWINFHDATRPAGSSAHTDAIQIMALTNSRFIDLKILDNFQGIQMATNMTPSQGFGPIRDNLFERITFRESSTNGSPWAGNFGGTPDDSMARITAKDCVCLDGATVTFSRELLNQGSQIINCPDFKIDA